MRSAVRTESASCQMTHQECPPARESGSLPLRYLSKVSSGTHGRWVPIGTAIDIGISSPVEIGRAVPYVGMLPVLHFFAVLLAIPVIQAILLGLILFSA